MPRRRVAAKRVILPDPMYGNQVLAKFINHVMVTKGNVCKYYDKYPCADGKDISYTFPQEAFAKYLEALREEPLGEREVGVQIGGERRLLAVDAGQPAEQDRAIERHLAEVDVVAALVSRELRVGGQPATRIRQRRDVGQRRAQPLPVQPEVR